MFTAEEQLFKTEKVKLLCSRPLKTGKVKLVCSWPVTAIQNRKSKINMFMAENCRSKKKKRNLRLLAGDSSLLFFGTEVPGHEHINSGFFCFEGQFPAMSILILLFLFWMAVPGREHINFTSSFISLLFLFSFHNKNVLFCFVLKINKKEYIASSMEKQLILRFSFTSISIQNN